MLKSIYDQINEAFEKLGPNQPNGVLCRRADGLWMKELYGSELYVQDEQGNWVKYEEPQWKKGE